MTSVIKSLVLESGKCPCVSLAVPPAALPARLTQVASPACISLLEWLLPLGELAGGILDEVAGPCSVSESAVFVLFLLGLALSSGCCVVWFLVSHPCLAGCLAEVSRPHVSLTF